MTKSPSKPLSILLSAYACEPGKGSEPGVGWEWATRIARVHDVTVLTRANNKKSIERLLGASWQTGLPRFIYHDLSPWLLNLKKKKILPVFIYYILWQISAAIVIKKNKMKYDVIHHVTFNGFRFPGAWWEKNNTIVLGPLGGGSLTSSQFSRCYGYRWMFEKLREFSVRLWRWNPWTLASLKNANMVLVVGNDLNKRFHAAGLSSHMMLETALPLELENERPFISAGHKKDFVWVGNLEPWKAWQIAFEAFALATSKGTLDCNMKVIGSGRQYSAAKSTAIRLGIGDRVDFLGQMTRTEVWDLMSKARALVFSSVRDTSGNVVLEAMGLSCPVICFEHQGAAMMTSDDCAFRIKPANWQKSVEDFAEAMITLAIDDKTVTSMGTAGRKRAVSNFTWNTKVNEIFKIYSHLTAGKQN